MNQQNDTLPPDAENAGRFNVMGRLRAYFFAGILITAPISITFYIAWLFIDSIDREVMSLLPSAIKPALWGMHGFGLLLVMVVLTLVGALTAGLLGRIWLRFTEALMRRTPVLRGIYSTVKQLFETVLAQKSQAFREVVLIEYPRPGIWTVAFITGQTVRAITDPVGLDLVNVFVPTTPNPTSGFLLFLPRDHVHLLDMTVEEGLKLVISGGIVAPEEKRPVSAWEQMPMA